MKKHFYTEVIDTSSISLSLGEMELSPEERRHLVDLAHDNLHHAILDVVLSELSDKDKQKFLLLLSEDDQEKIWALLTDRIDNVKDKIKKTADELKKELHKDIEESKSL